MDDITLAALGQVFNDTNNRTRGWFDGVSGQVQINRDTGMVSLNEGAIQQAFMTLVDSNSQELAEGFNATLRDGFAILNRDVADPENLTGIPWRAFTHWPTLATMTSEFWDSLGIRPWSRPDTIRQELTVRFPGIPPYMLDDERLFSLADWATRRAWLDRLDPLAPGGGGGGGWVPDRPRIDPPFDMPPASPPMTNNTPTIDTNVLNRFLALVKAAADCLINGQWSANFWGITVCFDRGCADSLQAVLLADGGGALLAAVQQILRLIAGGSLGPWGWASLGMFHFSIYWGLMIMLNKTPNGVCLFHLWPWWSGFTGGLYNGHCYGR